MIQHDVHRAALYARVSTIEQTAENQLAVLRSFTAARGWQAHEYVDTGISGSRERRPALDAMMAAVRARKLDIVACVKLDRLARSTHHLVTLSKELEALRVDLVVLDQAIDTSVPSGRLMFHVLAAIAEFERDLIRDRVLAGLRRAKAQGRRLGRPRVHHVDVDRVRALLSEGLSLCAVARKLQLHPTTVSRAVTNPSVRHPRNQASRQGLAGGTESLRNHIYCDTRAGLFTSSFRVAGRNPRAVAISRGVPVWFRGRRYPTLEPTAQMLRLREPDKFAATYTKQLARLDARAVAADLGPGAVMLCWEQVGKPCHRALVAAWLTEAGIRVSELAMPAAAGGKEAR
jgi:DNA invertase Pin-like site-specific DNA recombinase